MRTPHSPHFRLYIFHGNRAYPPTLLWKKFSWIQEYFCPSYFIAIALMSPKLCIKPYSVSSTNFRDNSCTVTPISRDPQSSPLVHGMPQVYSHPCKWICSSERPFRGMSPPLLIEWVLWLWGQVTWNGFHHMAKTLSPPQEGSTVHTSPRNSPRLPTGWAQALWENYACNRTKLHQVVH